MRWIKSNTSHETLEELNEDKGEKWFEENTNISNTSFTLLSKKYAWKPYYESPLKKKILI